MSDHPANLPSPPVVPGPPAAINLRLSAEPRHLDYAATALASVCRRTRRMVRAQVRVKGRTPPDSFQTGNLAVEFAGAEPPPDGNRCWLLGTDQLVLSDPGPLFDGIAASPPDAGGNPLRIEGSAVSSDGSARADLEWGRSAVRLLDWRGKPPPWENPGTGGFQLWLRELASWDELRRELAYRERDRGLTPAFVIHPARTGVRRARLVDELGCAGFAVEPLIGIDPDLPFHFRASMALLLDFFGWPATRACMARAMGHRWAWLDFLAMTDASHAVFCEDEAGWECSDTGPADACGRPGAGPLMVEFPMEGANRRDRCYCLSREAAQLLLELDLATSGVLSDTAEPLARLERSASGGPRRAGGRDGGGADRHGWDGGPPPRILIAVCSCNGNAGRRRAVRGTWFPRDIPGIEARFVVGQGGPAADEPDLVRVDVADDRASLPLKIRGFLRHALAAETFDWLFLCEDDTHVDVGGLAGLALRAAGGMADIVAAAEALRSGGAGCLLSREAVGRIAAAPPPEPSGDGIGAILRAVVGTGSVAVSDDRLRTNVSAPPPWGSGAVGCHPVPERVMGLFHRLSATAPVGLAEVAHPAWKDHVILHPHGLFSRGSGTDAGRWVWDRDRRLLTLAWLSYHPETFGVDAEGRAGLLREIPEAAAREARDKIVFVRANGRTGNQLFQYAYGLHLSRKFACRLAGNLELLAGMEGIPAGVASGEEPDGLALICEADDGAVARCLASPDIRGVGLKGIFQCYNHFEELAGTLRAILGPAPRRGAVGVHVRRGDYLESGHDMDLQPDYFASGVRQLIADNPTDYREIVIFSDDPEWCLRNLVRHLETLLPVRMFDGDEFATLREMKSMGGMVIANSTFGWWGAWLAGCPTVYPPVWRIPRGTLTPGLGCTRPDWAPCRSGTRGVARLVHPVADRSDPVDILAHMVETAVETDLVRYGPGHDGGYCVPAGTGYRWIATIGVGWDIGFETAYAASHPATRFVLFDHTVAELPAPLPNAAFHRVGVGSKAPLRRLPGLLEEHIPAGDGPVLLKLDCEGGEWDCGLEDVRFDGIHTLVLEIHGMLAPTDPARAARVLAAVADRFALVHAAPNNCSARGSDGDHILTDCVELTLVNRCHAPELPARTKEPPPVMRNDPGRPPAKLEIRRRRDRIPTIVSAFFDIGGFRKGRDGTRDAGTYRRWLRNFAHIENPLVFFAECDEDLGLIREIRSGTIHPTLAVQVARGDLRSFRHLGRVGESILSATFPKSPPNTTVAEYSCVQHAKYELVGRAISEGLIGTTRCCWMDCGRIFDSLPLRPGGTYQLQHRAELGAGIHYTRAAPFAPLPLAAVQSAHSGAGAYSHAGAFFYGAAAEMADWCGTYLEHALRYQEAGHVFTDQATLYAMLSEGLAGVTLSHPFPDRWFGLCAHLLREVRPTAID